MIRFKFNLEKTVQAIDFIARRKPGITQYYVGKILFFADREHLLDYGRPITGDRYVAMQHGPVPSVTRDLLKVDSGYPDEVIDRLHERIAIESNDNKQHIYSKEVDEFPALSGSDKDYLIDSMNTYSEMSFAKLKEISHKDAAYTEAWDKPGNANEIDISLWLNEFDDPEKAKAEIIDKKHCVA